MLQSGWGLWRPRHNSVGIGSSTSRFRRVCECRAITSPSSFGVVPVPCGWFRAQLFFTIFSLPWFFIVSHARPPHFLPYLLQVANFAFLQPMMRCSAALKWSAPCALYGPEMERALRAVWTTEKSIRAGPPMPDARNDFRGVRMVMPMLWPIVIYKLRFFIFPGWKNENREPGRNAKHTTNEKHESGTRNQLFVCSSSCLFPHHDWVCSSIIIANTRVGKTKNQFMAAK